MERYYARTACAVAGLTYRRLDCLIRSGGFRPDCPAAGKGTDRGFSFRDLLVLRCIGELRAAGVSLQAVRRVNRALRAFKRDLAGATLVVVGRGRAREVYVGERESGALLALLDRPGQSAWRTTLDVGRVAREVRAAVAREARAAKNRSTLKGVY